MPYVFMHMRTFFLVLTTSEHHCHGELMQRKHAHLDVPTHREPCLEQCLAMKTHVVQVQRCKISVKVMIANGLEMRHSL